MKFKFCSIMQRCQGPSVLLSCYSIIQSMLTSSPCSWYSVCLPASGKGEIERESVHFLLKSHGKSCILFMLRCHLLKLNHITTHQSLKRLAKILSWLLKKRRSDIWSVDSLCHNPGEHRYPCTPFFAYKAPSSFFQWRQPPDPIQLVHLAQCLQRLGGVQSCPSGSDGALLGSTS